MKSTARLLFKLDKAAESEPVGRRRDVQRNTWVVLDALRQSEDHTVLVGRASDLCSLDHGRVAHEIEALGRVTLRCVWMRRSRTGDVLHPRIAQVRRSYSEPWPDKVSTVVVFVPHLLEPSVALTQLLEAGEIFPDARLRCVSHCVDTAVAEALRRDIHAEFGVVPDVRGRARFEAGSRAGMAIRKLLREDGELNCDEPGLTPPIVAASMRRQIKARKEPPHPELLFQARTETTCTTVPHGVLGVGHAPTAAMPSQRTGREPAGEETGRRMSMPVRFDVSDCAPLRELVDALDEVAAREAMLGVARMFAGPRFAEPGAVDPAVLEAMTRDHLSDFVRAQWLKGGARREGQ